LPWAVLAVQLPMIMAAASLILLSVKKNQVDLLAEDSKNKSRPLFLKEEAFKTEGLFFTLHNPTNNLAYHFSNFS
jgi:hypothetical protein